MEGWLLRSEVEVRNLKKWYMDKLGDVVGQHAYEVYRIKIETLEDVLDE